ncbi:hypothetical protein [Heyndrickxia ginsengihumi]|uniref:hypothetical protein n=1 Tax=Heyndrickxia ginsengihumi TaxID=363870 RepID=UPI003D1A2FBC
MPNDIKDDKKALTLHVVIGALKSISKSDYRSEEQQKLAKELLKMIDEELNS